MKTGASKRVSRIIRYVGQDPSAVDPYWDFEHLPGEPFDATALRLWRFRVFVDKPARARLLMTRTHVPPGSQGETRKDRLSITEYVARYSGGPEREQKSYQRLGGSPVDVEPPSTVFVVDLTALDPGDFILRARVLDAKQEETELQFRIVRRPFFAYPGLLPGKSPVVRSYTGLRQASKEGRTVELAGYRWDVERWTWAAGVYETTSKDRIFGEMVIGADAPTWRIESSGEAAPNEHGFPNAWADYPGASGTGLPAPTLFGISGRG